MKNSKSVGQNKAKTSNKRLQELAEKLVIEIVRKRIKAAGYYTISLRHGSGGYRLIAEIDEHNLIVKVDHRDDRVRLTKQCESEIKLSKALRKQDRRYFPRILAIGQIHYKGKQRTYIVQQKADLNLDAVVTREVSRKYYELVKRYGIRDLDEPEIGVSLSTMGNWAITTRGELCIFDYGLNRFSDRGKDSSEFS